MLLKTNNTIRLIGEGTETIDKIPQGNWLVKFDKINQYFYIEKQADFKLPSKVYGDVYSQVNRYLNTYTARDKNLGILLKGLKGTGKSLTAKAICIKSELPVILITEPFSGSQFHNFLSNIKQECIIFIDEFEKVYLSNPDYPEEDLQKGMLSVFDGVFQGKKLFLLTANDHWGLNDALINRPGRIHYLREYENLSEDITNDVIQDLLINKEFTDDLRKVIHTIGEITIDSLTSLISECNMYNETPTEAVKKLNIRPGSTHYTIEWVVAGIGNNEDTYKTTIDFHPLSKDVYGIEGWNKEKRDYKRIDLKNSKVEIKNSTIHIKSSGTTFICKPTKKYKFLI